MRRLFFGLQDATGTAAEHVDYGSLRLWDAGVDWRSIEKAPGVYDWTRLDRLAHTALVHRVSTTLVVGGHTPACYGAPNSPPDPERFRAYATALLTRYSAAIRTYSAWNEVNGKAFWGGTPDQMIELCRILAEVRDAVNPSLRILSPSFQTSIRFQQRELQAFMANAWPFFDAIGISLYPAVGTGPEQMIDLAARCHLKLINAGVPSNMPLWGTEVNYDVGPSPATLLPDVDQVSNVLRTYVLGAASGLLSRLFWYRWDWGLVNGSPLANTYMTDPVDRVTPTPAGLAVQTAMDWLAGDHQPALAVDGDGTHRVTVRAHQATRVIAWNPETGARPKMIEGAAS